MAEDPLPPGAIMRLGSAHGKALGGIVGVAISADGKRLAYAGSEGTISVCDADGRNAAEYRPAQRILAIAMDAKGGGLAWANFWGNFGVIDLTGGKADRKFNSGNRPVVAAAFSVGGAFLAISGFGGVELLDTATGKSLAKIAGYDGTAVHLAVSPAGKLLATAGVNNKVQDYCVQVWDVGTGNTLFEKKLTKDESKPELVSLGLSPDGKTVAWCDESGTIQAWDVQTGKAGPKFAAAGQNNVIFVPGGKRLCSVDATGLIFWDTKTGKNAPSVETTPVPNRAPCPMAVSADESVVLFGTADGGAALWDVVKGKALWRSQRGGGHSGAVTAVALAADGKSLLSASADRQVIRWGLDHGASRAELKVPDEFSPVMAICGETARGVSASASFSSNKPAALGYWDLAKGAKAAEWTYSAAQVLSAALSSDGQLLAIGDGEGIDIRYTGNGKVLFRIDTRTGGPAPGAMVKGLPRENWVNMSLAFSADGKFLAAANTRLRVFELATGKEATGFGSYMGVARGLAFSPDGRMLAVSGGGPGICFWDLLSEGLQAAIPLSQQGQYSLAFSADGKRIASGGHDSTILIYDVPRQAPAATATAPATAPAEDQLAKLWKDLASAEADEAWKAAVGIVRAGGRAVDFIKGHIKPLPQPASGPDIPALIRKLDDENAKVRDEASAALAALGDKAVAALREARAGKASPEMGARIDAVLAGQADPRPKTPEDLRNGRAVRVLELIGDKAARDALSELAAGGPGRVTSDAQAALKRVGPAK